MNQSFSKSVLILNHILEMNNNYYPFKWIKDKIWKDEAEQMIVTPREKWSYQYTFASKDGEWLNVETDYRHNITSVAFTPKYKGVWISLKRAKRKWYKACWYFGHTDKQ